MIVPYVVVVVLYSLIDRAAFAASGAPTTRSRREWTFLAVYVPYLGSLAGPVVEILTGSVHPTTTGMMAGALCVLAAASLRWVGVTTLGKAFSAGVETHDQHPLVERGIYGSIRHPLYLGLLFLFIGLPLFAGARVTWVATGIGIVGLAFRIRAEEQWLVEHLHGYADYMARTKRLIPWLW